VESGGALDGVRVIDFGWVWAGGIPGQILADLGAEVIKVESRKRLDYMRQGRPLRGTTPDPEQNPWFHALNRNKSSVTINLAHPKGVELARRLILAGDVVIENFTPGFMGRIGLDYPALRALNPGLVMCSMSGTGQTGPLAGIRSYATIIAALSGMDGLVGYPGERVLGMQQPYADANGGLHAAFAILAALWHRRRTGQGQFIDLAQIETAVAVMGEALMETQMTGRVPGTAGNDYPGLAPHGHYPCRGEDVWVAIAVGSDKEWRALCTALGAEALGADARFGTHADRWRHRRALDEALAGWTRRFTPYELAERCEQAGVAAAPLLGPAELVADPHFRARRAFVEVEHPVLGREVVYGAVWRMSRTPPGVRRRAPLLGEHNDEVFGRVLSMPPEEIRLLAQEQVIG
jgi:benzylsuccinate CoA-transferase BbsF subunit